MYENFEKINGSHPWREVSPEGYIDYPVRYRKGGRVLYFNFHLAKEIGLIPKNHPRRITKKLEQAILKTFSLQILNEYDWEKQRSFPKDGYEDRLYMATRYLQTQHENKKGATSGDGRSIWNGYIKTRSRIYDISSCGTGNTILSPGAQESPEPIQTGSREYGYASGLADLDEMLGGAVMSEIFYREGYPSERSLVVIEYPNKIGLGVRTAPNLIRPAHFFRYLKSGQLEELRKSYDYFLQRQENNGVYDLPKSGKARYLKALEYITQTHAKLAAVMEEEYIFNWLAWDGDNMLASGALLDYGSIRQFAAKHNKYRYEDVDRYSTTLSEQRFWAKRIVQTFIQLTDFLITGQKQSLEEFDNDKRLELFDQKFESERRRRMLWKIGFSPSQIKRLEYKHQDKVDAFRKVLNYFEHVKMSSGETTVADGINHPPVFLVRHILRFLPVFILKNLKTAQWPVMDEKDFCKIMAASYVNKEDLVLNDYRRKKAVEFQQLYCQMIRAVGINSKKNLRTIAKRSSVINYEFRKTGDGLTFIINEAILVRRRMDINELHDAIERFIQSQVLVPGKWKPIKERDLTGRTMKSRLLQKMQENLELYAETI
ncbi:MAG: hypothetical protein KBD53_07090 [Candidatus Omnitrophica bacterium]|nr:hypothetical protein [Candidatus Omnitrophota bacterium]